MPPAPVGSGASPTSSIGSLLAGGMPGQGAEEVQAQREALAQKIREIGGQVDAIAADMPQQAQIFSQIKQLLATAFASSARQMSEATASSNAVPAGASMGAGPL